MADNPILFTIESNNLCIRLDLNIYPIQAIKKTCYKFTTRFPTIIKEEDNRNSVTVALTLPQKVNKEEVNDISKQFLQELLDENLRDLISKETDALRNLIIAQAFSKTSLID